MDKGLWIPIDQLEDKYTQPLWLASPRMVDLDTNQLGISDGFWQDSVEFAEMTEEDKLYAADGGHWVVTGWDMCNDEATTVKLFKADVTHFLIPIGPYDVNQDPDSLEYGDVFLDGKRITYDD